MRITADMRRYSQNGRRFPQMTADTRKCPLITLRAKQLFAVLSGTLRPFCESLRIY
jgi:hypothetical protein